MGRTPRTLKPTAGEIREARARLSRHGAWADVFLSGGETGLEYYGKMKAALTPLGELLAHLRRMKASPLFEMRPPLRGRATPQATTSVFGAMYGDPFEAFVVAQRDALVTNTRAFHTALVDLERALLTQRDDWLHPKYPPEVFAAGYAYWAVDFLGAWLKLFAVDLGSEAPNARTDRNLVDDAMDLATALGLESPREPARRERWRKRRTGVARLVRDLTQVMDPQQMKTEPVITATAVVLKQIVKRAPHLLGVNKLPSVEEMERLMRAQIKKNRATRRSRKRSAPHGKQRR